MYHETRRAQWMLGMMQDAGKANNNNANFQFWIQNSHPIVLDKIEIAWQRLEYIHNNPVEAGFVDKPEDWKYSSAIDFTINGSFDWLEDVVVQYSINVVIS